MRTIYSSLVLCSAVCASQHASAANLNVQTNPLTSSVKYSEVFIGARDTGSSLSATGAYIYHAPQARLSNGTYRDIFVNATNGSQFCRALGHAARNTEGDGGSITCGEDESAYANYNFFGGRWDSTGTGGSNQCYPLYKTIVCK